MASRLAPCPSCARHFKVGSLSCPFCGAGVPLNAPTRGVALIPGRSLTRAALMFAGVSLATGCSGEVLGSPQADAADTRADPEPDAGTRLATVDASTARRRSPEAGSVPLDASVARDAAPIKVPSEDAEPGKPPVADAGTSQDAGVLMHSEDASPGGPHCGASPAAYGVFAIPDACPYEPVGGGSDAGHGSFACGTKTCDSATQYCEIAPICHLTARDAGSNYGCSPLPSECVGSSGCSCIVNATGQTLSVVSDAGGCVLELTLECN